MEFLYMTFEILIIYIILSNILKIGYALKNKKKLQEDLKKINEKQMESQEEKVPVIETVIDPICNQEIDKDKAYVVVEEKDRKYFCSWDCRQKYIKDKNQA